MGEFPGRARSAYSGTIDPNPWNFVPSCERRGIGPGRDVCDGDKDSYFVDEDVVDAGC